MFVLKVVKSADFICSFGPPNIAMSPFDRKWVTPPSHSAHFPQLNTFPISISLSFPLPQSDASHWREGGGSSVHRSSHHLWNFRARPRWKGVLCPPDEECPCVAPQRKGFIWPGIWRNLEKCRGDFLGGGEEQERPTQTDTQSLIDKHSHNRKWPQHLSTFFMLWTLSFQTQSIN